MTDSIIEILNLVEEDEIIIDSCQLSGDTLLIGLRKKLKPLFCPICGNRLYSKGIYQRSVNHPILQDGRKVKLLVSKRKWECSSKTCSYSCSDSFRSFPPHKHSSNILPFLVLNEMKNLNMSTVQIAAKFNISDTYVHNVFMQYTEFDRLPLSEVISIDEVYMNFDYNHKYPLVILDFITGQPIDILYSRREQDTNSYFLSIPYQERCRVKYLVCDMYKPYINYVFRYFPNAEAVVDCFHVVKWINDRLKTYVYSVYRKYKKQDDERLRKNNLYNNRDHKTIKQSRECYILSKFKWVLLQKQSNIDYFAPPRWNRFLSQTLDTFQIEKMFLELDHRFSSLRDLKEMYFSFNDAALCNPDSVSDDLDDLISFYRTCGDDIFISFSDLLSRYRDQIILSYTFVSVLDADGHQTARRLSNGLIESFNNKPKDLKRSSKGLNNFDFARNRILWATRLNPSILAVPKNLDDVKYIGRPRGPYRKKS